MLSSNQPNLSVSPRICQVEKAKGDFIKKIGNKTYVKPSEYSVLSTIVDGTSPALTFWGERCKNSTLDVSLGRIVSSWVQFNLRVALNQPGWISVRKRLTSGFKRPFFKTSYLFNFIHFFLKPWQELMGCMTLRDDLRAEILSAISSQRTSPFFWSSKSFLFMTKCMVE